MDKVSKSCCAAGLTRMLGHLPCFKAAAIQNNLTQCMLACRGLEIHLTLRQLQPQFILMLEVLNPETSKYSQAVFYTFTDRPTFLYETLLTQR